MAKYRVLEKSFINGSIAQEGDVVEYDGDAGPNLEPLKVAKKGKTAEVVESDPVADPAAA